MLDDFYLNDQRLTNAATRSHWLEFAEHRRRVTDLILQANPRQMGHLGILGAGNVNDLDLTALSQAYARITLYDLDLQAMREGLARQFPHAVPSHIALCEAELTGALTELEAVRGLPSGMEQIERLEAFRKKLSIVPPIPTDHDCVVSACLLSQLVGMVIAAMGGAEGTCVPTLQAIRQQHLQLMAQATAPGGKSILLVDFVSSTTAPAILSTPPQHLAALARQLLAARNFFTGLHPARIWDQTREVWQSRYDPGSLTISEPWKWNLGPRIYLVIAVAGTRSDNSL